MKILNRLMSALGYVPAPAKLAASVSTIKIDVEVDRASMDVALAKVEQLADAAKQAEVAVLHAGVLDRAQYDSALAKVKRLTKAAHRARSIVGSIAVPAVPAAAQFATAELKAVEPATDPEREKLFCEMRALVWEIRQDRADRYASLRMAIDEANGYSSAGPATGASASGLPG